VSFYIISHRVKLEFHFIVKHSPREISRCERIGDQSDPRARFPFRVPAISPLTMLILIMHLKHSSRDLNACPGLYTRSQMRIVRGILSARVCARRSGMPRMRPRSREFNARELCRSPSASLFRRFSRAKFFSPQFDASPTPSRLRALPIANRQHRAREEERTRGRHLAEGAGREG